MSETEMIEKFDIKKFEQETRLWQKLNPTPIKGES